MKKFNTRLSSQNLFRIIIIAFLIAFGVGIYSSPTVQASSALHQTGYLDFSYGITATGEPTAEKPESKLWWNDGFWWGSLYNDAASAYHIYRLDWGTQNWEDTGVVLDDRPTSRADILWDSSSKKLYVASHIFSLISSEVNLSVNWGRLYRYSYQEAIQTYSLDNGFPVNVNRDKTETLVMDKDSKGKLWVSYVSRDPSVVPDDAQVYINRTTSSSNDASWGSPLSLGSLFATAHVTTDDISSIIAFDNKIGIMWSNLNDGNFYFAYHDDNSSISTGWTLEVIDGAFYSFKANDHIHLAKDSAGDVFAAIKTSPLVGITSQIGLLTREVGGVYSYFPLSGNNNNDTRPIVVVDDSQNKINIFDTSRPIGGVICYRDAVIVHPLSSMVLNLDNCGTSSPLTGPGLKLFIADSQYNTINNSTSSKQNVNNTTGLVVLASDDYNGKVYAHNVIGDPPSVITHRFPDFDAQNVDNGAVVLATFSKEMKASTFTTSSFKVSDSGGPISGSVVYDDPTRTVSFTPTTPLKAGTTYTVTVTNSVKDKNGQVFFGAPETWQFTTQLPTVQFDQMTYSVLEDGVNAVITVTLSQPSSQTVTVNYATSNGTAIAPADYTPTNGTLNFAAGETTKTFQVPVIDNSTQEGNKTINLTLANPSHATLGTQATALITIIEDDKALVMFDPGSYVVDEGAGFAEITVKLTQPVATTATVNYATSDGTANAPSDYLATSGTLTFLAGETVKTFQVPIVDDSLYEVDETVQLTLSNPVNVGLGTPNDTAILTITENDTMPQVMFSTNNYEVTENVGLATITVVLSNPSGMTSQVHYRTSDWTAMSGIDYTDTSGDLTFAPGEISHTFTIPVLDDSLNEPNKTVNLSLSLPSNVTLGIPTDAALVINDDDPMPIIELNKSEVTSKEASGNATVIVTLNTASGQTVSINYATSDGTATAGNDYQAVNDTLVFLPGEISKIINIHLIKDHTPEKKETFLLTLSTPDKGVLGTKSVTTIIIDDGSKSNYLPYIGNQTR